ncbi:hypothetical protein HaLaN_22046 [Haematococcus lacustris]|uniref:Uncharacterized protein n=1 Tax=Haematococcus lacustris TaxID=44745 RepID=A0A699ZPU4_HAELA|nr:hypothetical protein HaLaN_22046 [Haematococcus lacustris]
MPLLSTWQLQQFQTSHPLSYAREGQWLQQGAAAQASSSSAPALCPSAQRTTDRPGCSGGSLG